MPSTTSESYTLYIILWSLLVFRSCLSPSGTFVIHFPAPPKNLAAAQFYPIQPSWCSTTDTASTESHESAGDQAIWERWWKCLLTSSAIPWPPMGLLKSMLAQGVRPEMRVLDPMGATAVKICSLSMPLGWFPSWSALILPQFHHHTNIWCGQCHCWGMAAGLCINGHTWQSVEEAERTVQYAKGL